MTQEHSIPFENGPAATRHFTGWRRPALALAVELLAQEYRTDEMWDLSSVVVALPGARAGRRLLELLLEAADRQGSALRPPRTVTVGRLPELLAPPQRAEPEPLLARRIWAEELRRLPLERLGRLVDPPPERAELAAWMDLAGTILSLEETVGAGGHDFRAVAAACGAGLLFDDRERWKVLAGAQEKVRARFDELGLRTRSDHRRQVVERGEARPGDAEGAPEGIQGDLWLVGVAELPAVVRGVLAVSANVLQLHAVVHAPDTLADAFDDLGCVRPEAWRSRPAEVPDEIIRLVGGPRDQADALVRELARVELEGSRPSAEDVTVGVPDPEVMPFLEDRLVAEGVSSRRAGGRRIEDAPAFRLLAAVAEYLAEGTWESFAALLRHPDVTEMPGSEGPGGRASLAAADRYHAQHLPGTPGAGPLPDTRRTRGEARAVEAMRDWLEGTLLKGMRPRRRLSEWAAPVTDLLQGVYGGEELDPVRRRDRAVVEVARGVREALDGLASIPADLDEEVDGSTALRLLLQELRGRTVPAPAETEAVELLGWLELHLDDAPVLMVTGVNEPHLPESVTGDPFLPHALRQRLGLLDNDGRWARDLYRLEAMLASRETTVLISGRRNASGDPVRPSRLLLAEGGERTARRLIAFLRDEGGGRDETEGPARDWARGLETPADGPSASSEVTARPFALPPEPEIRDTAPPDSLAVTAFRSLLRDPYRFALEHVLKLEPLDDGAREVDPAGFGDLAHRVLQAFGEGPGRDARGMAEIRRILDRLLDREVQRRFGSNALPAVRIQVEQLRARLHAFAQWQANWVADGWRIAGVEVTPAGRGQGFEVDGQPFYLRGRIDRVDHHRASGRWVLFDYKTSARARTPEQTHRKRTGRRGDDPREWVDLQLPLYRHLIRGVRTAAGEALIPPDEVEQVELGYINLPDDLDAVGEALATEWSRTDLLEAIARAREAVRLLRTNRFVWSPEENTIGPRDGLAPLVGAGAYRDLDDEEREEDGGE